MRKMASKDEASNAGVTKTKSKQIRGELFERYFWVTHFRLLSILLVNNKSLFDLRSSTEQSKEL